MVTVMKEQPKGNVPIAKPEDFVPIPTEADVVLMLADDEQVKEATMVLTGREVHERLVRIEAELRRVTIEHNHLTRLKKLTKAAILSTADNEHPGS